jgi:Protein of unknown function (DUF2889)
MSFSEPKAKREALHRRSIEITGYRRDDGLFDIEGHLLDRKDVDFRLASGTRPAGQAIHSMWLRLTVDRTLTIVDAEAFMEAMPFAGECDKITPDYRQLIGLSLRPGYNRKLKEIFGGIKGCTHITELAGSMATATYQTMAGQGVADPEKKPFSLDGCHAQVTTGPVVAKYHPKWYRGPPATQTTNDKS